MKKIGILTSGGDCPGLNAVIRAVVKSATRQGWEVYGIPRGTDGFIHIDQGICQPQELKLREHGYDIPGVLQGLDVLQFLSGSILGSLSKGNPNEPAVAQQVLAGYQKLGLDALVVVGGDGSLDIICTLAEQGQWNIIAVPKTIDNDVPFTEQAVGFNTAVNTVTDALYDLTFTAASHDRVMVVQVMGRDAGHLGLSAGIAGGADVILIPERVPQLTDTVISEICYHLAKIRNEGRKFALLVVAEGVRGPSGRIEKNIGEILAQQIKDFSRQLCESGQEDFCSMEDVDTRSTVLGHIQRSGTPSAFDRLLATSYGTKAVELIAQGYQNQIVLWQGGKVVTKPLAEVLPVIRQCHQENRCAGPVSPDSDLVQVAQALGVYVSGSAPDVRMERV